MNQDDSIENGLNLGPTSSRWLEDVGILTLGDLSEVGVVEAYERVKSVRPKVSLNLLYALQGALTQTPIQELSSQTKLTLRRAVGR